MSKNGQMSINEKISWARNTIESRLLFGLDELGAALTRERRANGVLMDCENHIQALESQNKKLVELVKMVIDPRLMPHQHKDPQIRLYCLVERAQETLKELGVEV